jgi:hypothetical protein
VQRDSAFRRELLREGVESFLTGDVETGKSVLRDYINATIGFRDFPNLMERRICRILNSTSSHKFSDSDEEMDLRGVPKL